MFSSQNCWISLQDHTCYKCKEQVKIWKKSCLLPSEIKSIHFLFFIFLGFFLDMFMSSFDAACILLCKSQWFYLFSCRLDENTKKWKYIRLTMFLKGKTNNVNMTYTLTLTKYLSAEVMFHFPYQFSYKS